MEKGYYAIIPATVRYDKDLSANAKLLYGEITALTNAEGYCWATNAYFAELYKVTKVSISLWIKQLIEKGYITSEIIYREGTKEILNRYLRICEGGHKEKLNTPIKENLKDNNTGFNTTKNITKNKKPMLISAEIEQEFEYLWKLYPRKMGKKKAFDSYIKARKGNKTTYETVENGLYRYIDYIKASGTDEQFIQHGSTWFNQQKWLDEYTVVGLNRKPKSPLEAYNMAFGGDEIEYPRDRKIINDYPDDLPQLF